MTSPNIPSSSVESSSQKASSKMSMIELLSDVTENRVFDDLHNEADLLKRIQNSPGDVTNEIRQDMKGRLLRNPSEFESFTEKDINDGAKLSDKTILDKIRLLLLSTTKAQEKLRNKVVGMYDISTFDKEKPTGKDNNEELDRWIEGKNENEILRLIKSPALLRKNLKRHFGEKIETFVRVESVFFIEKLGMKVTDLDEGDKACLYRLQLGGGLSLGQNTQGQQLNTPDFVDVRRLLQIIDKGSATESMKTEVKRDIIREYLPSITPKLLTDLGIITEDEAREKVKTGLEEVFGNDYFTTGTDDERKERKRFLETTFKKGWYIEVPIDEYLKDDAFVKNLVDLSSKSNTALTENIHDEIKDLANELTEMKYDMGNMKISPDAKGNWHESFIENIKTLNAGGKQKVKNPENFQKGSYFRVIQGNENGEKKYGYYRIVDTDIELSMPSEIRGPDGFPLKHRGIKIEDWTQGDGMVVPGNQSLATDQRYGLTYDLFARPDTDIEILTESEMTTRRSGSYDGEDKIKTVYTEKDSIDTLDKLSEGLGWKPEVGKIYSTNSDKGLGDFFVEIKSINEGTGTLKVSDGVGEFDISFSKFLEINAELKMKDIGDYSSEENITKLIQTISGFEGVFVKDGKIQKTIKDENGKDKDIVIQHFMNEEGEGMSIGNISGGNISAKYGKIKDWEDKKGKVNLGKFPGGSYNNTIVQLLTELKESEYKPYENPKDQSVIDAEANLPHSHGSLWGKLLNGISVSDMMKSFDLYKHAWEHKLEKNSKFQSAKFADKYLRKLMPEGFSYQLRSEAYAAQNEAMEGILKMLENDMSGKEARLYVRKKILLNDDAKFEEVLAGLLYISKKTGQLYPEELSDLKNSELWFYKLAVTQGYNTKASRANLRRKCIEKSDKSASGKDAVSEMDIVERQLKLYEGAGKRIPPNIAPKFPGAIVEGKKGNQEKGELEVNQRTNIKQMNKYALSKGNVGEWWKVMGTLDRIHSKNGSAVDLNAIPFIMLMSNAPEYMGSEFRKALHSEGTGKRASHAFKFGNELSLVQTYRDTVMVAAREADRRNKKRGKITNIAERLDKIEHERHHIGNESHSKDTEDEQKKWVNSIFDFWMEHGEQLQPILQMSDTFIDAEAMNGNKVCKAYKQRFTDTSTMQNGNLITGGEIYKTDNVGEGNMIPDHTPYAFTNLVNASFSAIYPQNGKMGTSQSNASAYGKIFKPGVLGALDKLKSLQPDDVPPGIEVEQVQYARFREYYAALAYYLRSKGTNPPEIMLGGEGKNTKFDKMEYISDLEIRGFNFNRNDIARISTTKPAGAEEVASGGPNELELDIQDEQRCREMFVSFKRSAGVVKNRTHSKIDWDSLGA